MDVKKLLVLTNGGTETRRYQIPGFRYSVYLAPCGKDLPFPLFLSINEKAGGPIFEMDIMADGQERIRPQFDGLRLPEGLSLDDAFLEVAALGELLTARRLTERDRYFVSPKYLSDYPEKPI